VFVRFIALFCTFLKLMCIFGFVIRGMENCAIFQMCFQFVAEKQ